MPDEIKIFVHKEENSLIQPAKIDTNNYVVPTVSYMMVSNKGEESPFERDSHMD